MAGVGLILGIIFLMTTLLSLHTWTGEDIFHHYYSSLKMTLDFYSIGAILGLDTVPAWANCTLTTKSSECAVKLAQIYNKTN